MIWTKKALSSVMDIIYHKQQEYDHILNQNSKYMNICRTKTASI